jgi:hypothetical protein
MADGGVGKSGWIRRVGVKGEVFILPYILEQSYLRLSHARVRPFNVVLHPASPSSIHRPPTHAPLRASFSAPLPTRCVSPSQRI